MSTVSVKLYIMSILATGRRSVRVCVYSVCKTLHYVDIFSYWSQICKGCVSTVCVKLYIMSILLATGHKSVRGVCVQCL